jgi:hypothetical protein
LKNRTKIEPFGIGIAGMQPAAIIPLQNLIDYREGGELVEDFIDAFPSVKRERAIVVIEAGKLVMLETV